MRDLPAAVRSAVEGGVTAVMLREKDLSTDALVALGRPLRSACEAAGVLFVVNHDVEAAHRLGADGVHLGGRSVAADRVRAIMGTDVVIGRSTHDAAELRAAEAEGVHYVTYGPVFDTPSKRGLLRPRGLADLAATCRSTPLPVVALGGVDGSRVAEVVATGVVGVAAIRAVFGTSDPAAAARALRTAWGECA